MAARPADAGGGLSRSRGRRRGALASRRSGQGVGAAGRLPPRFIEQGSAILQAEVAQPRRVVDGRQIAAPQLLEIVVEGRGLKRGDGAVVQTGDLSIVLRKRPLIGRAEPREDQALRILASARREIELEQRPLRDRAWRWPAKTSRARCRSHKAFAISSGLANCSAASRAEIRSLSTSPAIPCRDRLSRRMAATSVAMASTGQSRVDRQDADDRRRDVVVGRAAALSRGRVCARGCGG